MNEYVFACVEAFQTAWTVVGGTSSPRVSNDDWKRSVAILCAPQTKPPEHFWKQWPKEATTFDLYFRAGDSALGLAVGFTESISGCIRIASVEALQRFWRDALESDEDAINRWRKACEVRIANVVIEMSQPKSFQAMDLLRRKIALEMAEHNRGPQGGDLSGPARGHEGSGKPPVTAKKLSVNARMIDALQRKEGSKGWSVRKWQEYIGCKSTSTIHSQLAWKALQLEKSGKRYFTEDDKPELD